MAGNRKLRGPGDLVFWGLIAVIGVSVAGFSLRHALRDRRETRAREEALDKDISELKARRDRLRLQTEALERGNPDEIERELRNSGYDLPGTVRLVPSKR